MAISDPDKDKMKLGTTSISSWLQSVATFCALVFKKYPIELTAIIQYVINQLKNCKSHDLLILQEIVQKMCGIEVLSEVNDLQLEAMAGGDLLRQEAGYFNPIRNIKKCANRLKEALADHGLILPLCILLSQQRDYIVYSDAASQSEKRHLKLTGSLFDQCQDSLVQFSQFLSSTLTTEEYIQIFPKIDELVNEYHVSADVAFFLSRPMYAHHIQSKYEELRRIDRSTKTIEKPSKTQRYLEAIDIVMQPVIDLVRTLYPAKIWEDVSPLFYTTFWTLTMSDCFVPTNAYDKQRQSLKQKLIALDENVELTSTKKKKEKEKLMIMIDKLTEEENKQSDHVQHVRARLDKEKEMWFPQKNKTKNETITVFLQLCIFSRCLFTQIDAYYCAKFIKIIHSLKTPNFSTIICYDRVILNYSFFILLIYFDIYD
jgi:THO complex subunit 2